MAAGKESRAYPYVVMPSATLLQTPRVYLAGVYCRGRPLPEALLFRHYASVEFLRPYAEPEVFIDAPAIYCGRFFSHYGHFLLESLSRLTLAKMHPSLLCCYVSDGQGELAAWQREILSLLGLRNTFWEVTRPTAFRKLVVPPPGYVIPTEFAAEHAAFLACVTPEEMITGKKTYLSRALAGNRVYANEAEAEEMLRGHGWNVLSPETLSVREQLREIASSEIVLGIEGSAFHTILLFRELRTRMYAIRRDENENFVTIRQRRGFFYKRIDVGKDGLLDIPRLEEAVRHDSLERLVVPDDAAHRLACRNRLVRTAQSPICCSESLLRRAGCLPGRA